MFLTQQVGSRGVLITFDDLVDTEFATTTNIFIINGDEHTYIFDTFLGPEALAPAVSEYLDRDKPVIVINSHYHWDHIWGNCFFKNTPIIAHHHCWEKVAASGESELTQLAEYARSLVKIVPPTLTFTDRIHIPQDHITIMYTPGHTLDSISLWDELDRTLVAGDNVEYPIPSCMETSEFELYAQTLQGYLELQPKQVVPGHGPLLTPSELRVNLEYLIDYASDNTASYEAGIFRKNHLSNLNNLR